MTSTVKVTAHCVPEKQVKVSYVDNNGLNEKVLQDGESWEGIVYDDKTISVQEELKAPTEIKEQDKIDFES